MPSNLNRWTAMEDNILYTNQHLPCKKIEELLQGRSLGAVKARMHYLGIKKFKHEPIVAWHPDEDKIIRLWFKILSVDAIRNRYLPLRTNTAIYSRAQRLGLTERSCKIPKDDIELIVQLFMDPELSSATIAKKFDLDPAYCHRLAWKTLEVYKDTGKITQEQYLRTLVLRTANSKNRAVHLDRLIELVASKAEMETSVC